MPPFERKLQKLNVSAAAKQMAELGLSQAALAEKLGVSRESISQWFKNEKFPKPASLLGLARALELPYEKLVIEEEREDAEPIVAFRKKARRGITPEYLNSAKANGQLLEAVAPFLPYDTLHQTPVLKDPRLDYEYIQLVAKSIRDRIQVPSGGKILFSQLIQFFRDLNATLIPVFLGHAEAHENALHIYLPKSQTTWIYLNLDSHICDFKFWMAHELGHVIAPSLKGDQGEDFADSFAAAVLVDRDMAAREYVTLHKMANIGQQVNHIKQVAGELMVSPLTVYYEINKFAEYSRLDKIHISSIHAAVRNFEKEMPIVSNVLFESRNPAPIDYITKISNQFQTPFFSALKKYLTSSGKGASLIHKLLYLPMADAQQFYEEICRWEPTGY